MIRKSKKKALFLHIQKTAGTSIVDMARQHYGKDIISHGDYAPYAHAPLDELHKVSFISGHFGYGFAQYLMDARYSFTFLRDPAERILSLYYFYKNRDPHESLLTKFAHELTLESFLKSFETEWIVKAHIWNNQVWMLASGFGRFDKRSINCYEPDELLELAISHLDKFSHIGLTETFEQDKKMVLAALDIPCPPERIVSNSGVPRPSVSEYPESTQALLRELTRLDSVLYREVKSRRQGFDV